MTEHKAIGFEINCMKNRISRHLGRRLAAAGFDEVTILHGWILGYIYFHQDQGIFQKDFEHEFGMAKSTVTNILQLLEKKGYVTRNPVSYDARLKSIRLTELGTKVHLDTTKIIDQMHAEMEQGISREDKEALLRVFYIMKENMKTAEESIAGGKKID